MTFGRAFWPSVVLGWGVMAIGVAEALQQPGAVRPTATAAFVIGVLLVHDLVIAPLTCLVAVGIRRGVHGPNRAIVSAAVIMSVLLTGFSIPFIAGWGRIPDNPSFLPGNYARSLGALLLATWFVAGIAMFRSSRLEASQKKAQGEKDPLNG